MKFLSFLKTNLKFIIPIIIIIILAAVYFIFFFNKNNSSISSDKELIYFSNNYKFAIPEGYAINSSTIVGTTILVPDYVKQFDPQNSLDLINKGAIIIKSFPTLDKNDEFFEKYIKERYNSNDQADYEVTFEEVNGNKVATLKIQYKSKELKNVKELFKIINLSSPVAISTSEPSAGLTQIIKTISNFNFDKELNNLLTRIKLMGTLINKVDMSEELYSILSKDLKESMSLEDFKTKLTNSKEMCQRQLSFSSGELNKKINEFSFEFIFMDPEKPEDFRAGNFAMKKEGGEWKISKFELPKDDAQTSVEAVPEGQLPEGVSQEDVDKALEKAEQ